MGLENAQSVGDDVLDVRLPVLSLDLVLHKLENILEVGPKLPPAKAGNLGLHDGSEFSALFLLAVLEVEVDGAESHVLALCVFEQKGLELGIRRLGRQNLVYLQPPSLTARALPAIQSEAGFVEQSPELVGRSEHSAASVQQHVF